MSGGVGTMPAAPPAWKRARHWRAVAAAACVAFAGVGAAPAARGEEPAGGPARGLIVQLRAAVAHERIEDEVRTQGRASALAASAHSRVQRVLAAAGIAASISRPVGRAAQLLDFGRTLSAREAAAFADKLRRHPEVEWVVPNERERSLHVPDDPMFAASPASSGQWWLFPVQGSNSNVPADRRRGVPGVQSAWGLDAVSTQPLVAVLDTGITPHAELAGQVLPGYDFVGDPAVANDGDGRDADPSDPGDWVSESDRIDRPGDFARCDIRNSTWHGTIIAGILAAATHNGSGVAAVAWNARVLPVRVGGKCGADVADIVDGMRWAAGLSVAGAPSNPNPARVLSISFGGSAACNAAYQSAIDELASTRGAVVVAAAGNDHGSPVRPANCAQVIGVAALNRDGFKSTYSNFGPQLTVATVGGDSRNVGVWGPWLGDDGVLTIDNRGLQAPAEGGYSRVFGTSFAAPIAAGVVGLMLGVDPSLSAPQLIHGLRVSARPHVTSPKIGSCSALNPGRCLCTVATCGAGILDAEQALLYARDPAGYQPPTWPAVVIDNPEVDDAVALGPDLPANESPHAADSTGATGGGALQFGWLGALVWTLIALRNSRPRNG